ncbi:SDR family NAD(P)-dependent oxidoreductase [Paracoccus shanxieyensis]|uniref:SDR family NAD(P)-dependent oxidoreductase n=1 Tax=Paracoccus shanxieyensis TaxID=2675752 RepID=A0A6L6J0M4_9RHOB|nr:SDR family NAD(P)-dependent oxidoreductase [Paracoccus shanxieyensis]MTH64800.1 SDR family NAD(P)-dependent oxidoreductase [Paracoccus shanxieyensis]MTH87967.1 SDR family NAD(P)-dependent oxidoreductase [Paracoccus shanxieyensis]
MSEKSKIALVTGASRGLGAALAEGLAARGMHVLAVARTVGALEELDDRIRHAGGSATLVPLDLGQSAPVLKLAEAVSSRWGGLDLWVHSAVHAAPLAPAGHIDGKDFQKSIDLNVVALRGMIGLFEPLLRARQGTALFFDDPRAGEKFFGSYGASKAAQMALLRSWQAECAQIGPRVRIATPAPMPTATRARFFPGEDRGTLVPCRDEAERILGELL